ncbi:hypothetical protein BpHYR1_027696 [Brachionus plicatilis]|uniref:Uncharacterized protein n=1 Tax=Brachionus plicatilis TaxID=10195 RepID=A0A3M7P5K4_BRAPC|nr:hypothetical protein BpHYR1_027696 [Brachionus plicatilis]
MKITLEKNQYQLGSKILSFSNDLIRAIILLIFCRDLNYMVRLNIVNLFLKYINRINNKAIFNKELTKKEILYIYAIVKLRKKEGVEMKQMKHDLIKSKIGNSDLFNLHSNVNNFSIYDLTKKLKKQYVQKTREYDIIKLGNIIIKIAESGCKGALSFNEKIKYDICITFYKNLYDPKTFKISQQLLISIGACQLN